jgi:nitroreductase
LDAIEALLTRSSNPALGEPAPPPEILDEALRCAASAPDHGRLKPARFIVVEGEKRHRLGDMFAVALMRNNPNATAATLEREAQKPLRAPVVLIAICALKTENGKVPPIEQMLSVGAAVENVLLALHAHGFGAIWRTGTAAYDDSVKQALGLAPTDAIVGFIYVGTPQTSPRRVARAEPAEFTRTFG